MISWFLSLFNSSIFFRSIASCLFIISIFFNSCFYLSASSYSYSSFLLLSSIFFILATFSWGCSSSWSSSSRASASSASTCFYLNWRAILVLTIVLTFSLKSLKLVTPDSLRPSFHLASCFSCYSRSSAFYASNASSLAMAMSACSLR